MLQPPWHFQYGDPCEVRESQDLVPTFRGNTVKAVDFDAVDMLDAAESEERLADLPIQLVEGRCFVLLYAGIHPFVIAEKQQLQTQLHHGVKGRDGGSEVLPRR